MSQPPEYPGSRRFKRAATRTSAGGAYEGAFEAVGAILIATGLGYWFDHHYGTTPVGLLVGAVIGFAAFVLRLIRLGRQLYPEEPDPEEPADSAKAGGDAGEAGEEAGAGSPGSAGDSDAAADADDEGTKASEERA